MSYEYDRQKVAEAACVSCDVVRMEEKKGTFDTVWGLCRWVVAKRLIGDALGEAKKVFPNMVTLDSVRDLKKPADGLTYDQRMMEDIGYVPEVEE